MLTSVDIATVYDDRLRIKIQTLTSVIILKKESNAVSLCEANLIRIIFTTNMA